MAIYSQGSFFNWKDGQTPPIEERANELVNTIIDALQNYDHFTKAEETKTLLLSTTITSNHNYVGRNALLAKIHYILQEEGKLFLHGIGGIGKSEAALQYMWQHRSDYTNGLLYLTYSGSLRSLIVDDTIKGIRIKGMKRNPEETEDSYYHRKLARLREIITPKTLIVIDNYDVGRDPQFDDLAGLNCSMIITTRNDHHRDGLPILEVEKLSEEEQMMLFSHYSRCRQTEHETAAASEILNLAHGHTLTIKLLGELTNVMTCRSSCMMLEFLHEQGLLAVLNNPVDEDDQTVAYEQIRRLFRLYDLDEQQRYIMTNMALMPTEGVDFRLFVELCGLKHGREVDKLIRKGLLQYYDASGCISVHPLIAQVVMAEEEPTEEKCQLLIENLSANLKLSYRDMSDEDVCRFCAIVESLYSLKKELVFSHRRLWIGIQTLLCRAGKHKRAIEILSEVKTNCLENHEYELAATVLYLMMDTYAATKDIQNAHRCCEEGVAVARQGSSDELGLAYLLKSFASRSMDLPDKVVSEDRIKAALDEAVSIVNTTEQRTTSFGYFDDASVYLIKYNVYYILAKYYIYTRNYHNALMWANRAYEIIAEHAENDEQRKFARASYQYMAEAYAMLGEKEKAREYIHKQDACWEGYFSPNHLNVLLRKLEKARLLHIIGDYEEEKDILEYAKAWLKEKEMTNIPLYQSVLDQLSVLKIQ